MPFDQKQYIRKYTKENYDEISIRIKKKDQEAIKAKAKEMGKSVSQLVVTALEKNYLLDLSKDDESK